MSSAIKKQRRRLAALTFLSNISLDGTHNDTKLAVFQRKNVHPEKPSTSKTERLIVTKENNRTSPSRTLLNKAPSTSAVNCLTVKDVGRYCRHSSIGQDKALLALHHTNQGHGSKDKKGKRRLQSSLQHLVSRETFSSPLYGSTDSLGGSDEQSNVSSGSDAITPEIKFLNTPIDQPIGDERLILVSAKKAPFVVFSSLPYRKPSFHHSGSRPSSTGRPRSANRQLDSPDAVDLFTLAGFDRPEEGWTVSYCELLASPHTSFPHRHCRQSDLDSSTSSRHQISLSRQNINVSMTHLPIYFEKDLSEAAYPLCYCQSVTYDPNVLDDNELSAGKHRTVLTFSSYVTSIIYYIKPSDLKKELNTKFREKFPRVQLTLSKLRSLKREMYKVAKQECGTDLVTVAQAYVYFEKLVLKLLINKHNRKLCAGACLLLSAKLNDIKRSDLKLLIEKIESCFRVSRKELLVSELRVLVALEFSLHLSTSEVFPHYQRLVYES